MRVINNNMSEIKETWKTIPSFPNYEASNLGFIRRTKNNKVKKASKNDRGYYVLNMWCKEAKKFTTKKLARLVWEAFAGCDCAEVIDHIDDNPENNHIDNLRCVSKSFNSGRRRHFTKDNKYELTDEIKIQIITDYRNGNTTSSKIFHTYGVPSNYFFSVVKRKTWDKIRDEANNLQETQGDSL